MRTNRMVTVIAAGLALSCLFAGAGQASATSPAAGATSGLVFLSDSEYSVFKSYLDTELARHRPFGEAVDDGVQAVKSGGGTGDIRERRVPAGDPWFIMSDQKDRTGADVPARRGLRGTGGNFKGGFGYAKYSEKHNVTSIKLVHAAITRGTRVPVPERQGVNYEGHVVGQAPNGVAVDQKIIVVTRPSRYSYALRQNSPDGKPVGVITAFCEGSVKCPNEVNDLGS